MWIPFLPWLENWSQFSFHPPSNQPKSTAKRKLYEDGSLSASLEGSKKVAKKPALAVTKHVPPAVGPTLATQATRSPEVQGSSSNQPSLKKQKSGGESARPKTSRQCFVVDFQFLLKLSRRGLCCVKQPNENKLLVMADWVLLVCLITTKRWKATWKAAADRSR